MARGKAITKAVNIVSELLASLDHEKGGTVSANLQQIYLYVHKRLLEAHAQQRREPLDEAENLLATLLSGWKKVAEQNSAAEQDCIQRQASHTAVDRDLDGFAYGAYFAEGAGAAPNISVAC
jgi:flagellin-specific chaperone FliS